MPLARDAETEARRRRRRDREMVPPGRRCVDSEPDGEREERPKRRFVDGKPDKRRRVSQIERTGAAPEERSAPESSSALPESPSLPEKESSASALPESPSLPEKVSSASALPESPSLPEKESSASALPKSPSLPEKEPSASAIPEPPSLPEKEPSPEKEPGFSSDEEICDEMAERFKQTMEDYAANKLLYAQQIRGESEDCNLTVESEFCDIDDDSSRSWKARKVALLASKSVVSLSSFSATSRKTCHKCLAKCTTFSSTEYDYFILDTANSKSTSSRDSKLAKANANHKKRGRTASAVIQPGTPIKINFQYYQDEKRIRVCSGFMIGSNRRTNSSKILTSATLVRSLCARNIVIPDLKVKVCLPNGHISEGLISMVDFHYNLAMVEVKSDEKLPKPILVGNVIKRGAVLAIGRFYDHGGVMCAQGKIRKQTSTFDCSELLVSSCHTTMAGVGGPLVNYSGHVVGINFYGEKHTPFLSSAIIIRCLDQWAYYGQINRPWLGFICTSVDMLPFRVLEKCTYVDKGLYISDVVKGSPFDVAGLSAGDVFIECAGEVLSTAAELNALLLDLNNEYMEATLESNMTVEVVVRKQKDGRKSRKIVIANFLSECHYYRWVDPLPSYNDKKMVLREFRDHYFDGYNINPSYCVHLSEAPAHR